LTVVDIHFIFRHRIGGEVLHNFLLSRNISNFALSRIVDEIANTEASPETTWSSLLAWAMDAFSCAHKELSEPRWSCSYWWTSLKPLCCGSGSINLDKFYCRSHAQASLWCTAVVACSQAKSLIREPECYG
jgi:hypothetical protein